MSDTKKTVTQEPETQEEEKVEVKKPAKKPVKKEEPEKKKLRTRIKEHWERNKKAYLGFGGGVVTGAAGAVTYGIFRNRRKRKKAEEIRYIPEDQVEYGNGSPLDPNV